MSVLQQQGVLAHCALEPAPSCALAAGADDLSVKRFSRRQLLQTGGIATRVWTASVLLARWAARHMHALRAMAQCGLPSAADQQLFGSGKGRVLELGCGLGVAGIAAAMCGCSVLLTDSHGAALSSCRAAVAANAQRLQKNNSARAFRDGGQVKSIGEFLDASGASTCGAAFTMDMDWNRLPHLLPHEKFSCIIAADIVHEEQHAPLVASCIRVRSCTGTSLAHPPLGHVPPSQHLLAPRGVCLLSNADAHSRYGMDLLPQQLQQQGLCVVATLPLPLQPPPAGEDETLADVLQHHLMVIARAAGADAELQTGP